MVLQPNRRGMHQGVVVDIATAAPFALQWWTRRVELPLPSALHVSPRRGRPQVLTRQKGEEGGVRVEWIPADEGETRGARPYTSGDNRRQVHWRATAHTGELMVRERERQPPSAEPVTVKVVLPGDPEEAERVAERALGTVVRLLSQGSSVQLATLESSGAVIGRVMDRRAAGRRLARAVAVTP
jgi:uncharacterized protein (DUF58 family)